MDIHDLRAFKAVYERQSLTETARANYVTRQALSKTISHLEAELGPLFIRKARGVVPTSLAKAVYPHVCQALSEFDDVRDISTRFASGRAGSIRLAVEANAALTLPARLFEDYVAARPEVHLSTEILPPNAVREALASGKADAILAGPPSMLVHDSEKHPAPNSSSKSASAMAWSSSQSLWVALWLYSAAVRFPLRSSVLFRQMRRTSRHTLYFPCRLCLAGAFSVLTHRTQWSASSPPSSKRMCPLHASPSATPTPPLPQV